MRKSVAEKAVRYLAEGRVKVQAVTPAVVKAEIRGSAEAVYHTRREGRRWSCDCPPGNASAAMFEPSDW